VTVIIKPIKWTALSFAVPVIPAPLRERTGRNHAAAVRCQLCNYRKGLVI
jgi:hypothetical protein